MITTDRTNPEGVVLFGVCSTSKIVVQTCIFETYLYIFLVLDNNNTYFNKFYWLHYFGDVLKLLHNIVQRYNQNVRPKSSILTTNIFMYCISQVRALGCTLTIIHQYFFWQKGQIFTKTMVIINYIQRQFRYFYLRCCWHKHCSYFILQLFNRVFFIFDHSGNCLSVYLSRCNSTSWYGTQWDAGSFLPVQVAKAAAYIYWVQKNCHKSMVAF